MSSDASLGDTLGMWGIMAENRLSMRIPAVAVAVPSDIQTLHLTTPRVSPNTPAGWWF